MPAKQHRRVFALTLGALIASTVVASPSGAGTTTPASEVNTSAVPTDGLVHHDFENGAQGWQGESLRVSHDTSRSAVGNGSLRLTQTVTADYAVLRANDGNGAIRNISGAGDTLSAWVLIPDGTPGAWRARLDVQDQRWSYHGSPAQPLTPGEWTELSFDVPPAVAERARAFAVQFDVTGATGQVSVNIDEHGPAGADPEPPTTTPEGPSPTGLRADGGTIRDAAGREVRLLGVNHSGLEYACAQGWGFFDGPSSEATDAGLIDSIASWQATAVRVPMNEHCWLDIDSGIPPERRGAEYRKAVTDHVEMINARGMVAILDLHWHAPGTRQTDNNPMANRDNSPRFWASVAEHFKGNDQVVFELVNEPHPDGNQDTDEAWRCWRDGGTCSNTVDHKTGQPYVAAGMQELLDAVRGTGADQLVLVGGIQYNNRLSRWLEFRPQDPMNNIGAAWHAYNFNACTDTACYTDEVKPVADQVPLVVTEMGPDQPCMTCAPSHTGFSETLLDFLDAERAGYTGWTWNLWQDPHVLTTDWAGEKPTAWGVQLRERLAAATAGP